MEKIIICKYWENKTCKFMDDCSKCMYAHGIDDINRTTVVDCKYGINCYNAKCKFNHGNISTIPDMVYDVPIIDKRKNRKIKNRNVQDGLQSKIKQYKNVSTIVDMVYDMKEEKKKSPNFIKIINKDKSINEKINFFNKDYNKLLNLVDDFYIKKYNTMVYSKNRYISQIIRNNYKNIVFLRNNNNDKDTNIKKLKSENESLIKITEDLKNENKNLSSQFSKNNIEKRKVATDKNKLKNLYNKYLELYKIFNNNSYKLINLEEIKKYTMDKNIYKVKQRATKVYKYYEKYKNGIINELLPISRIISMVV